MSLTIQLDNHNSAIVVQGELDGSTLESFKIAIQQAREQSMKIVFDFSGLSFLDSLAIGFLLYESRKMIDRGYQVHFRGVPEPIMDVFDLLGIPSILGRTTFN